MSQVPMLKKYDFKSVGRLETGFQTSLVDKFAGVPVGIKTPMELSAGSNAGPFRMTTNLAEQIRDNFRNMLATNHGDRLMLYDFGANLQELVFELSTEDGDVRAINKIRKTTEKYMPFVQLDTFETLREPDLADSGLSHTGVRVIYSIPKLGISNQGVEVIIHAAG